MLRSNPHSCQDPLRNSGILIEAATRWFHLPELPEPQWPLSEQDMSYRPDSEQSQKTAQIVTQAALTGHLLLSQLHARNGVSAVKLLHDLGIPTYMLREIVTGIVTQRLVRRLCTHCRKPLSQEEITSLPNPTQFSGFTLYKPEGCDQCHQTGFRGRSVMMELFEPHPEFWPSLSGTATVDQLMAHVSPDHKTLMDDGIRLVKEGTTCMSEVNRVMGH